MISILRGLAAIASAISTLVQMWREWRIRKEAREGAIKEIADKEAEATKHADAVIAEPRPDDDGARRLRDGNF